MLRFTALLLTASLVVAAPVPKPGKAQLIAVTVDTKSGHSQLTLVDEDGKKQKELTDAASNASYPAWSPDGKKIAYCSGEYGGVWQVFVMDADGKNVTQLTNGEHSTRMPSWSPDGKRIAYCCRSKVGSDVVVMDLDGKNADAIGEGDARDPAFSPDGKHIVFTSSRERFRHKLFRMNANGAQATRLLDEDTTGWAYPAWSPDGKRIAFGHLSNGGVELHVIDADGTNLKAVTDFGGYSLYPGWTTDGAKLSFVQYKKGGKAELVVADPDGKNPKAILKDFIPAEGGRPAWRPK